MRRLTRLASLASIASVLGAPAALSQAQFDASAADAGIPAVYAAKYESVQDLCSAEDVCLLVKLTYGGWQNALQGDDVLAQLNPGIVEMIRPASGPWLPVRLPEGTRDGSKPTILPTSSWTRYGSRAIVEAHLAVALTPAQSVTGAASSAVGEQGVHVNFRWNLYEPTSRLALGTVEIPSIASEALLPRSSEILSDVRRNVAFLLPVRLAESSTVSLVTSPASQTTLLTQSIAVRQSETSDALQLGDSDERRARERAIVLARTGIDMASGRASYPYAGTFPLLNATVTPSTPIYSLRFTDGGRHLQSFEVVRAENW